MHKKSIEGFVVRFVHSNITIIDVIIWKAALLKKIKKKLFPRRKKKSLDSLLYDSNNANDPRFTVERTHLHNPRLLLVIFFCPHSI